MAKKVTKVFDLVKGLNGIAAKYAMNPFLTSRCFLYGEDIDVQ